MTLSGFRFWHFLAFGALAFELLPAVRSATPQSIPAVAAFTHFVTVAAKSPDSPRNDCGNVVARRDGSLYVVWHKYRTNPEGGSDFGRADLARKISRDGGKTWTDEKIIVPAADSDLNIQAPALVALPDGTFVMAAMRAHAKNSSSMCVFRSTDQGETWTQTGTIWDRSAGQWLQGGANSIVRTAKGRLIFPFHGGTGDQGSQHNVGGFFVSDDEGRTWRRTPAKVDLPMRGVMEQSVAQLADGRLIMSIRSQLGTVMMCESRDEAESWSLLWSSGLTASESCTCLRRIPGTDTLVLLWNGIEFYEPKHHHYGQRSPLSLAVSRDAGRTWQRLGDIESDPQSEFTNLGCYFTPAGDAVVTYWVCTPAFSRKPDAQRNDLQAAVISKAYWDRL